MISRTLASVAKRQRSVMAASHTNNTTASRSQRVSAGRGGFFPAAASAPPRLSLSQLGFSSASRCFSTEIRGQTAAANAARAAMAAEAEGGNAAAAASTAAKKNEPNVFLDHLGKIFLMAIASVIGILVRSSYNTSNRNVVRDAIEDFSALDPKELEEFREANAALTPDRLSKLLEIYYQDYHRPVASGFDTSSASATATISYEEFLKTVRTIMATKFPEVGESFTLEMGHYLDRIVVSVLEQPQEDTVAATPSVKPSATDELPVGLLFACLAAAANASVTDRIKILHEILVHEEAATKASSLPSSSLSFQEQPPFAQDTFTNNTEASEAEEASVSLASVRAMVGHLQQSCQLPPDTQIVPTDQKIPTQQWKRATPEEMVPDVAGGDDQPAATGDALTVTEFAAVLRTKSVCAWGECYNRCDPDPLEFQTAAAVAAVASPSR